MPRPALSASKSPRAFSAIAASSAAFLAARFSSFLRCFSRMASASSSPMPVSAAKALLFFAASSFFFFSSFLLGGSSGRGAVRVGLPKREPRAGFCCIMPSSSTLRHSGTSFLTKSSSLCR